MFNALRQQARLLGDDPAGERFTRRYQRGRSASRRSRFAWIAAGAVLLCLGLLAIPLPGPGWLIFFLGVGLLGGESKHLSGWLDNGEVRARKLGRRYWTDAGLATRAAVTLIFIVAIGGAFAATAYLAGWRGGLPGWLT